MIVLKKQNQKLLLSRSHTAHIQLHCHDLVFNSCQDPQPHHWAPPPPRRITTDKRSKQPFLVGHRCLYRSRSIYYIPVIFLKLDIVSHQPLPNANQENATCSVVPTTVDETFSNLLSWCPKAWGTFARYHILRVCKLWRLRWNWSRATGLRECLTDWQD